MNPNPIFNLKRFNALIGSGFYRKGNKFLAVTEWILASMLLLSSSALIIRKIDVELDTLHSIMIRVYQISYVIVLSIPALSGQSHDDDKMKLWRMLPASMFEKTLYYFLRTFIWFSILFFAAQFLIDRLFWFWMSDINVDTSAYHIGIKEIFTLTDYFPVKPEWFRYVVSFFYLIMIPLCANGYNSTNKYMARPFSFYLIVVLFIQIPFSGANHDVNLIFMILLSSMSVIGLIAVFTESIIKSYRSTK